MLAAIAAIACDHPDVAALLLAHGADVAQVDKDTLEMASSAMRAILAGPALPPPSEDVREPAGADAEAPLGSPLADDA